MVRHSKGMMVGGIVMTSLAPVAVAVASLAWLGETFCNVDDNLAGPQRRCGYDSVIYGSLLTGAALIAVGVPLIVIGAKKEPADPDATATITPWATRTSLGVGLRISM